MITVALGDVLLDVLFGDFVHKAGDAVGGRAAVEHALSGADEVQLLLCARDCHIAEPPLLLHLLRLANDALAGEDALLHAHDEHSGEFQPLGGVHRHQHHAVRVPVVIVQIGVERDVRQVTAERQIAGILHVLEDAALELLYVFRARDVLFVVRLLKHTQVTGLIQNLVIEFIRRVRGGEGAQLFDHVSKKTHLHGRAAELGIAVRIAHDIVETEPLLGGDATRVLDAALADASGRHVQDARETQIVSGTQDHREIGEQILHLCAVKEARAAEDAVGDAGARKGLFNALRLGVDAVKHRVIAPARAPPIGCDDAVGDVLRLLIVVIRDRELYGQPRPLCRPELLALAPPVVADDAVGCVENVPGAAVVLLEAYRPAVFILRLEGEYVLDRRPAELVDALVVVAHDADVPAARGEQGSEQILQMVCVLIFIHQNIAEALRPVIARLGVILQELDGEIDQVVKVHGVCRKAAPRVFCIDLGVFALAEVVGIARLDRVFLRPYKRVLRAADIREDRADGEALLVQLQILEDALDEAHGIGGIVDREIRAEAEPLRVTAQDAHAGGVEGAGPDVVCLLAEHAVEALLQLAGGLVCEGDREDAPGLDRLKHGKSLVPLLQQAQALLIRSRGKLLRVRAAAEAENVGDAVDEHGRLPAAGSCENEQRPFRSEDGFLLHGIERSKAGADACSPRFDIAFFKISHHGSDFITVSCEAQGKSPKKK